MIPVKELQKYLKNARYYFQVVDGIEGESTLRAYQQRLGALRILTKTWNVNRQRTAIEQLILRDLGFYAGTIDGIVGPETRYGWERWQDYMRHVPANEPAPSELHGDVLKVWPTQTEVPTWYGPIGANQILVKPPYQFYLYDSRTKVKQISLHKKCADSAMRVMQKVLETYGEKDIHKLHLDRFFGSLNVRKMRGGTAWSMHSWGIAIDFDANNNQLRWGSDKALFAKSDYTPWWQAWEREGWVSLGRQRNYDWMHVQAARL